MTQWVYRFGEGKADGRAEMKNLLGGKGANLAEMSNLGLPVPPGFTITTEVCTYFYQNAKAYPAGLEGDVKSALGSVETQVGRKFGDADNPLLVSVRSGARVSMPGMMDTVLNLGLNDKTAAGLAKRTGNPRFAYDSYRRFIQMYGHVVLGVDHHHFEELLELHKEDRGVSLDTELGAEDWQKLIEAYKAKVKEELGEAFPQDPLRQLWGAIGADRAPELAQGILGKRFAQLLFHLGLVSLDQLLPILRPQFGVEADAAIFLVEFQQFLEMMMVDAQHYMAVHLDEAAIAVIGEAGIAGAFGKPCCRLVVEAEIENGIHHAGHGDPGSRAHRNEQRIVGIAEFAPNLRLDRAERRFYVAFKSGRIGLGVLIEIGADLGGNGEPGRHRQAEIGHLRQIGALAPEQVFHFRPPVGFALAEAIDPLSHLSPRFWRNPQPY